MKTDEDCEAEGLAHEKEASQEKCTMCGQPAEKLTKFCFERLCPSCTVGLNNSIYDAEHATPIDRVTNDNAYFKACIMSVLELLEPQVQSLNPSLLAVRTAVKVLKAAALRIEVAHE